MSFSWDADQTLISLPAGADLSSSQYCFVKVNSSGQAILCSSAGEAIAGVLQNKPTSGQVAQIAVAGVSKVKVGSGGALTAGDLVATDGSALAKTAVKTTVSGANTVGSAVFGVCLNGASNPQFATMLIQPQGSVASTAA